jgi:hypothetical protein
MKPGQFIRLSLFGHYERVRILAVHRGVCRNVFLPKGDSKMNYVTRAIMALLKIDADTAILVQSHMDIDFSECTTAEMNREIRFAYAMVKQ